MYKYLFFVSLSMLISVANAADGRGRVSMASQMNATPRAAVVSKNQITAAPILNVLPDQVAASVATEVVEEVAPALAVMPEEMIPAEKDNREAERAACVGNNVGFGNTFVWASRYSNLNDYYSMVEDVNQPENNTCFVKIELKSNDNRINVDDIKSKYYEWGKNIECGSWVDSEMLKQRILDAKKKGRTWATVGGAVGGAGIGVGVMEAFGNRLIGGQVMGQKQFENGSEAQLRARLAALEKDDPASYKKWVEQLGIMKDACADRTGLSEDVIKKCDEYAGLFDLAG